MKRRLLTLLIGLLGLATPAQAAFALVNVTTGTGSGGATTIAATAASVSAGNLLVVGINHQTSTVTGIADLAGNTFASCAGPVTGAFVVELWYAANTIANASNVVTVTFAASTAARDIHVLQYSGAATSSPCETSAVGTSGGGAVTSASFSPAIAGNLNVAAANSNNGASTWTAGAGYTVESQVISGSGEDFATEDRLSAVSGAQTASITPSSGNNEAIAVASFKAAAGGECRRTLLGVGC